MQNNTLTTKANKILYISVIAVLCLTALIVGIVASVTRSRNSDAPVDNVLPVIKDADDDGKSANETENEKTTFISPAKGTVTKAHSTDTVVFSDTMNDYRTHTGIDIATTVGAEVYAACDGTITKIWDDEFMGKCISIEHAGDAITIYKNLSSELAPSIAEGVKVKAGQVIASVGESASSECAEEPHLHFELLVKNKEVDPMKHLEKTSVETSLTFDSDVAYEG